MTMETINPIRKTASRLGFWFASLMAVITFIALALAVTTLPMSGPFCQSGCVTYPYEAVAAFVPHDYIWMYPAFFMAPIFVMLQVCIHNYAPDDKKIFSQSGLVFALIYAAAMSINYFIQIEVMQPSILKGEMEGLALFSQYNPHGIFIALEDLGYLMMSLSFFCTAWVFARGDKLGKALRNLLTISPLLAFAVYIVLSLIYGKNIEYRFEVFIITFNWITAIVMGILLSIYFRRAAR
jgi:hypothetical protein